MKDIYYRVDDNKKFPRTTGVYQIGFTNSHTGRIYIGSASATGGASNRHGFRGRWCRHISSLRNGSHHSHSLLRAYMKYGEDNMFFRILEFVEPSECLHFEQKYIEMLDTCNDGYNITPYAKSSSNVIDIEKYKKALHDKYMEKNSEILKKLKDLYDENKNVKEISKILGIDSSTGYFMLKKMGIYEPIIRKKVHQYDLNGNLLNIWDNNKECAKALEVTEDSTRRVLVDGGCQSCGCFFDYKLLSPSEVVGEYKRRVGVSKNRRSEALKASMTKEKSAYIRSFNDHTKKCIKNIAQYDLGGNLIKVWKNSSEIEKIHGKAYKTSVVGCIRGVQKTCRGFKWSIHYDK